MGTNAKAATRLRTRLYRHNPIRNSRLYGHSHSFGSIEVLIDLRSASPSESFHCRKVPGLEAMIATRNNIPARIISTISNSLSYKSSSYEGKDHPKQDDNEYSDKDRIHMCDLFFSLSLPSSHFNFLSKQFFDYVFYIIA